MSVTVEMKHRVNAKLEEVIAIATARFDRDFEFPAITYKKRGTTAGTACSSTYTIDLNAVLLMENGDTFINRTVVHEFAHLVDAIVHPETRNHQKRRSVHGPTWKSIMRLFGADPSRCHKYDVSNSKVKKGSTAVKYVWTCGCGGGEVVLGEKRHARQTRTHGTHFGFYQRGHTSRRCGFYTHTHTEVRGIRTPTGAQVQNAGLWEVPKAADNSVGKVTGNKLEKCKMLYRENYGAARKVMIQLFVEDAGCTVAGAATYFAKIKAEMLA